MPVALLSSARALTASVLLFRGALFSGFGAMIALAGCWAGKLQRLAHPSPSWFLARHAA
jgi:hypothetical protein